MGLHFYDIYVKICPVKPKVVDEPLSVIQIDTVFSASVV